MNKRILLNGLLIAALILGFSACKTEALEDVINPQILFQGGRWEIVVKGSDINDTLIVDIEKSESASDVPNSISTSQIRWVSLNGSPVTTHNNITQTIYMYKEGRKLKIYIGYILTADDWPSFNLDGVHNGTTAAGSGDKFIGFQHHAVTFTARKL